MDLKKVGVIVSTVGVVSINNHLNGYLIININPFVLLVGMFSYLK